MRRATVRTAFEDETEAAAVAAAVRPDNTPEIHTDVSGSVIETTIERETTGGLRSTVDDYVVNVSVAARIVGDSRPPTER